MCIIGGVNFLGQDDGGAIALISVCVGVCLSSAKNATLVGQALTIASCFPQPKFT